MNESIEEMEMNDVVEILGKGSLVQHGKHNDRVYLMKLAAEDKNTIIPLLAQLALSNKYSKIFCKIPKSTAPLFFSEGYLLEAFVPKFYNDVEDVFFVSKFLSSDRLLNLERGNIANLSGLLHENSNPKEVKNTNYFLRRLDGGDVHHLATLYDETFKSYPFPINDADYILKTMDEHVQYYGAFKDGKLAAASSAEIDVKGQNAEMTDFATSKAHQGNKLASLLLRFMENEMQDQDVKTLYTIARVNSVPMNKTFLQNQYKYSGTLVKNTNISGSIESMNVHYKNI